MQAYKILSLKIEYEKYVGNTKYYKAVFEKRIEFFVQKVFSNNYLYDNIYLVLKTTYNGKEDDIIEI